MAKRGTKRANDQYSKEETPSNRRRLTRSAARELASNSNDQPEESIVDRRSTTTRAKGKGRAKKQVSTLAEEFISAEENDAKGDQEPRATVLEDDDDDESDMDVDWENVDVEPRVPEPQAPQTQYSDVEVVFEAPRAVLKKSKWQSEFERQVREALHHTHVLFLIGHYMIRNTWCTSKDVQAVCLSVIPDHIQKQCDRREGSETEFQTGVKWLLKWWRDYFTLVGTGLVTRAYSQYGFLDDVDLTRDDFPLLTMLEERDMMDGENIPTTRDFIDKLASKKGFRDTSGELFVAILRALSFDARLVCSLQPVPYRIPAKRAESSKSSEPAEEEELAEKPKFPIRTPRPQLESNSTLDQDLKARNAKPPTVWAEIYNPHAGRWICVDPIRGLYDHPKAMQPGAGDRQNNMSIVLAFPSDRDGCVDVTRRYASNMAKAVRLRERELTKREKKGGFMSWWGGCYRIIQRKRWGPQEQKEQDELDKLNTREPMPTSIQAFNNHELYALERHLKKFEVLHPKKPVLGHIKGEAIYPRSCVKLVHTVESWMKRGRVIKGGEQPVKRVNARAVTLEKRRAQELAKQEGETLKVGCYGEWQTEVFKPPAVVDAVVPRNAYGRVDLFTPEMLPIGAAHIPINGIGKIARRLGIDCVEAVVDFEFVRGRSVPVTNGVVVAKQNKAILLEAWEEHEQAESNKAIKKQEKEVYSRWRKLILGVLIEARLERDYGESSSSAQVKKETGAEDKQSQWESFLKNRHDDCPSKDIAGGGFVPDSSDAGGFLPEEDE
ncbi:hypothetical protein BJV82DRAFT_609169 [Fennellomyces sp. T-0311]|nr:hypothetical protein BJV82DRAFT_609169 [Fennellomyces sp. T-0311]